MLWIPEPITVIPHVHCHQHKTSPPAPPLPLPPPPASPPYLGSHGNICPSPGPTRPLCCNYCPPLGRCSVHYPQATCPCREAASITYLPLKDARAGRQTGYSVGLPQESYPSCVSCTITCTLPTSPISSPLPGGRRQTPLLNAPTLFCSFLCSLGDIYIYIYIYFGGWGVCM